MKWTSWMVLASLTGLMLLTACTAPPAWLSQWTQDIEDILTPETDPEPEPEAPVGRELPQTKLTLVMLNGQPTEIELELFDHDEFPLTLYTPRGQFLPQLEVEGDLRRAWFQYLDADGDPKATTYLQLVVPVEPLTVADLRDRILGETGLIAQQGWQMTDRTSVLTYSWAEERIDFQHQVDDTLYRGSLFLGDRDGQTFYALTYVPQAEMADLSPRFAVILDSIDRRN
jgi:hypothetical protein